MSKPKYRKDELSLHEVLESGGAYIGALRRAWVSILAISLIAAALSFFYFSSKPILYKARLSFMLNEDESSQLSSTNAILGQFGFPIMNQRLNISKVLELSKSRKIIQDAIFQEKEINSKTTYLANHIIDAYELSKIWVKKFPEMENFNFEHSSVDSFSSYENIALRDLAVLIAGTPANRNNALIETDYGQNTTIMSYVTHSIDQLISYHLTNEIFESTSTFYVEKAVEKQMTTYNVLASKKDSLVKEYNRLEYKYADLSDRSSGLFSKKSDIKRERARAEMLQMGSALAKLEENLAFVEFGIENNTPILQIIDAPILPLEEVKMSSARSVLLGLMTGLFLGIVVSIMRTFLNLASE